MEYCSYSWFSNTIITIIIIIIIIIYIINIKIII